MNRVADVTVVGVGVFLWCVVLIFVLHFQHDFQFASVMINKLVIDFLSKIQCFAFT